MPENFTWEEGAAVPAAFITAWEGLIEYGEAAAWNWVLLCGASSGVGVAALQIAKNLGCRVIVTSGSANKIVKLKSIGADEGIVARGSAFVDEVMRITEGKGVDVSLNMVGGTAFPGCVQVAGKFGRVVFIGYVDGQFRADCDLEAVHAKRLVLSGISNAMLTPAERALATKGVALDVFPAFKSGAIKPVIDRVFAFDELPAAKQYVETDQLIGKVIVRIS